ncbi:MAG: YcgN family cysteine cluster protein [Methylococcaceae bacterium]
MNDAFWKEKKLIDMNEQEWESLCDGCGKCCLHKLEDADTGQVFYTSVVCDLNNLDTCRCTKYSERCSLVPDCLDLKQHEFADFNWLPATCAYRLLSHGEDLPDWHPLVSGNPDSIHKAGVSIRSYAMPESDIDSLEDHIIEWLE